MAKKSFKEKLKTHQVELIINGNIFDDAKCGRVLKIRGNPKHYSHILEEGDEDHNLFPDIRDSVKSYFNNNNISFWGGKTITPNTLSSQVSCLNHLFLIRGNHDAVRDVMQSFVGDRLTISKMCQIKTETESFDCQ